MAIDQGRRWLLGGLSGFLATAALAQVRPPRGGGSRSSAPQDPEPVARDVVSGPGGRAEYVLVLPRADAARGQALMEAEGALLLRRVELRALGRSVQVYDLRSRNFAALRLILEDRLPGARLDLHHLYRFAEGPRLYAAAMLGETPERPCRLTKAIRIGLIDGLVDAGHPALKAARVMVASVLREGEKPRGTDHANAVAALMVGDDDGGALTGFAVGAELLAVAAFASVKGAVGADVMRIGMALDLLIGAGVRLINMSFAGPQNAALAEVLSAGLGKGAVIVAAVGNDGAAEASLPAGLKGVIGVTAVDAAGRRYGKANRAGVDFAAPGVEVYAAKGAAGGYVSGTSFAAPIVTALAARLMAGGVTSASGLQAALAKGARDLGESGPDRDFGFGLVQASACR